MEKSIWFPPRNRKLQPVISYKLSDRVDRKVLKWFFHADRLSWERSTKTVYESEDEERWDILSQKCVKCEVIEDERFFSDVFGQRAVDYVNADVNV